MEILNIKDGEEFNYLKKLSFTFCYFLCYLIVCIIFFRSNTMNIPLFKKILSTYYAKNVRGSKKLNLLTWHKQTTLMFSSYTHAWKGRFLITVRSRLLTFGETLAQYVGVNP